MCLHSVDEKLARKYGIGYKLLEKRRNGTYTCYDHTPCEGTITYPLNQWITDPRGGYANLSIGATTRYRTGFHISLDKENMVGLAYGVYVVVKVKFRKVIATSCDYPSITYGRQVVAREIMNLGEVSG